MIRFTLNGSPVEADPSHPHTTLLSWLRSRGLTGTKEGCAEGECGACAVAMLRSHEGGGAHYEAVNSCLFPLASADGRSVVTVEGVAQPDGTLHPVQSAMIERAGSQCGYCTPGFVVSLFCEYYRPDRDGYDAEAISGNLCRCTGYRPIIEVARALPKPDRRDPRLPLLREPVAALGALHCAGTSTFARPTSLSMLFDHWDATPDASLIAGGTDLMVYANQRHQRWPHLIALEAVPELHGIRRDAHELTIGAGVELAALERSLAHEHAGVLPALEQLFPLFSSRLIRNRATLGGSLGTASPIGDAAPVLLALDAELTLVRRRGARRVPLRAFFTGYRKTQLAERELILDVHIPLPAAPIQRFYKVSKRVLDDISTVAAAFTLELDDAGKVTMLRAAYGGIAATPLRAYGLEQLALGRVWSADTISELQLALRHLGTPQTDHRGGEAYRRAMIGKLLEKFYADTVAPQARSA